MNRIAAAVGAALLLVSQVAQGQNLIRNGSFEFGTFGPVIADHFVDLNEGSTKLSDWTIDFGTVNWHRSESFNVNPAQDGRYMIDFVNNVSYSQPYGGISQSFATTPGEVYRLGFWLAGPGGFTPNPRVVEVDVAGALGLTFSTPASDANGVKWEFKQYDFTAAAASTTLAFRAPKNSTGYWGPFVDNVSVSAVPEPSTYALFGAGLLGLGVVARRRRPR